MTIKYRIKKEEFDKLSEDIQKEYTEKNGEYILNVEGADDGTELRRALENERNNSKQDKGKIAELERQINELDNNNKRKDGRFDEIEADYKNKLAERDKALEDTKKAYQDRIAKSMIDAEVNRISNEISTSPRLMQPFIRERMNVEFDENGEAKLSIKDKDGKASTLDAEGLKKEFSNDNDFKNIIIGSKAGGAGGPSKPAGGGAPHGYDDPKPKKSFSEMSMEEKAKFASENYGEVSDD